MGDYSNFGILFGFDVFSLATLGSAKLLVFLQENIFSFLSFFS